MDADRWSLGFAAGAGRDKRLGDHAAARYRHFRRFVERQRGERLDHALFGLLLSAESMRDEMRAFEEQPAALARLAMTGHLVRQLQRLHGVLDAASAGYALKEPTGMKEWEVALAEERAVRAKRAERLVLRLRGDHGEEEQARAGARVAAEMETPARQEEVLTLLAAAVSKYGRSALAWTDAEQDAEDVLTPHELRVTRLALQVVSQRANAAVVTLPEWFAAPFEFGGTFGLSRWGNDLYVPPHADPARLVVEASTWSRLNHPHVAKFLGACHVGDKLFIAHEKVKPLSDYAEEVADRAQVWRRLYEVALSLQYLHERGLACQQLDVGGVFCAKFEAKALLLGVGLVELDGGAVGAPHDNSSKSPWTNTDADRAFWRAEFIASDVRALGVLILNVLRDATDGEWLASDGASGDVARFKDIPKTRPGFLSDEEWQMLERIRSAANASGSMLHVITCLGDFVGVNRRDWLDESGIQDGLDEAFAVDAFKLPTLGETVKEVLARCEALSGSDKLSRHVYYRVQDIFDQLQAIDGSDSPSPAVKKAVAHFSCVLVRFDEFLQAKHRRDASRSLQPSCSFASHASHALLASRRDPPQVFRIHMDVDRMLREHGLDTSRAVHGWEPQWTTHCAMLESLSLSVLVSLPTSTSRYEDNRAQPESESGEDAKMVAAAELTQLCSARALPAFGHASGPPSRLKLPSWFVPPTEVDVQPGVELGRGSFGSVHLGKWFDTPVVVKRVFVNTANRKSVLAQFRHEADVWFQLNHINVVKLYGACHVSDPFFVCEHASGGTVDSYLARKSRDTYLVWYSLLNAALGLQYLHDNGVVHGDLKANNILVGADDVVKLADFGLSTSTRGSQEGSHTGGALGAYRWKAPECLSGKPATLASDVYSLAMVMIELASGAVPWGSQLDNSVIKYRVTRGELPLRPREIADAEWRLIQRMCCLDPTDRVTIDAVVIHLTSLLEKLDLRTLRSSSPGKPPAKSVKNRVLSRGGALLSLLTIMKSSNKRLAALAADHLLAVHMNRGARSEKREVEGIVDMLVRGNAAEKLWAADALESLSSENDGNRALIAAANGIEALVALSRDGTKRQKSKAAAALRNLAVNADNKEGVAAAGGIAPLLKMLRHGTHREKADAAGALRVLASSPANKALIASAGAIEPLVAMARDGGDRHKEEAVGALMRLAENRVNKTLIASAGGIPVLVSLAADGSDSQKEKAATALRHLAVNSENSKAIVAAGGIDVFVALVRDGTEEQKEDAAGALMKLATTAERKKLIAVAGAIDPLVALFRDGSANQRELAAGTLRLLAACNGIEVSIAAAGAIEPLVVLARSGTVAQKEQAAGALRNLAVDANNRAVITSAGGISPLVKLVRLGTHCQKECAAAALRSLAATGSIAVSIAAAGGIRPLVKLMVDGTEPQREQSVGALQNLTMDMNNKALVAAAGATPHLIALARDSKDSVKASAAGTLRNLAVTADNKALIAAGGGVPPLVALVQHGTEEQKERAAGALRNLAVSADIKALIIASGGVGALVALARDGTWHQAEAAAGALRSLALSREGRAAIFAAGGVDPLITLLEHGSMRLKDLAAGAMRNMMLSSDRKLLGAAADAIGPLVALARNGTDSQKENAVGALRGIAASSSNKPLVAAAGGIDPLVALARSGTDAQKEQAAGALQTLALDNGIAVSIVEAGAVDALVAMLRSDSDAHKEKAASGLWNLSRSADAKAVIAQAGAIPPLVELVRGGSPRQKLEAAGALRNLAASRPNKVLIAAAGGIRPLVALLRTGSDAQRGQAVGALEHLASSDKNAFMIAQAGAVKLLVEMLRSGSEVQKEQAAGALGRIAANPRTIAAIAAAGAVDPLAALLRNGTAAQRDKAEGALHCLGCIVCATSSRQLAADAWRGG